MPKRKILPKQEDTHVYLDLEVLEWLRKEAAANGRTMTGEIRWRLRQQYEAAA
jgi:hypothetical protein